MHEMDPSIHLSMHDRQTLGTHKVTELNSTRLRHHTIACLELLKQVIRGLHFHLAVLGLLQSAVGFQTGCFNYFLVGPSVAPDLPCCNGKGPPAQYINTQGEIQHPGNSLPIHHTYPACTCILIGQYRKTSAFVVKQV